MLGGYDISLSKSIGENVRTPGNEAAIFLLPQAEQHHQHEAERHQRRAVKMQAARKAAIEDLQRKREEKRRETERIAQEEIVSHMTFSQSDFSIGVT